MRFLCSQCIMLCTAASSYMRADVLFAVIVFCLLSTVRLLFVYCPSTLCLLFIYCLSTFQVPSQTGCSPSLRCTDAAAACSPLLGHSKKKQQKILSRRLGTSACNSLGGAPGVSEPCMLTLITCHTTSSKWCLSRRKRMQCVVYLVCQSLACHAPAGCSASAVPRQPESRPQPSALGSIPSPAVCESALNQCSLHTWHEAEEAQMAGGRRREEEEERRRKEDEDRRKKRRGRREEQEGRMNARKVWFDRCGDF